MKLLNILNRLYDEEILEKLSFLKSIKLFEGIRKRQLIHVLESLQERTYLKGETIFTQGDIGRALFIVFSGKLALSRLDRDTGHSEIIAEVQPGEFFGEMALLEEMPRTAGAYALEETRVFMLFKIKLETLFFARPKIGVIIATQLATELVRLIPDAPVVASVLLNKILLVAFSETEEALTAADRPYKKGKTLSETLGILGKMKMTGHIDPDLFDVFVWSGIYTDYARQFLNPDQIDDVDLTSIPGCTAPPEGFLASPA